MTLKPGNKKIKILITKNELNERSERTRMYKIRFALSHSLIHILIVQHYRRLRIIFVKVKNELLRKFLLKEKRNQLKKKKFIKKMKYYRIRFKVTFEEFKYNSYRTIKEET